VTDTGVCTNAQCARATRLEPIERYPGPGEYCPNCGERLRPYTALHRFLLGAWRYPFRRSIVGAGAVIVALAVIAGLIGGMQSAAPLGVRVCTSTMTDRVVQEIIRAYSVRHRVWPLHYNVTRPGELACDVRFSTALTGPNESVIARDAVVAVVNPQNPIGRLDIAQLRDVLAGRIVDWSQVGGRPGAIVAVVPDDGSDEARVISAMVMLGKPFGSHVIRVLSTREVVRSVSSPSGLRSIGIAPFSAATPAKVIALGNAPAPSPLSIADGHYPLSVRIMVESDLRFPPGAAAALIAFARSADANELVVGTDLVSKDGY
jgi:hypothetical protein